MRSPVAPPAAAAIVVALSLAAAACTDDPLHPAPGAAGAVRPRAGIIAFKPTTYISITDLGTLGGLPTGHNHSRAYGINDSGEVTGWSTMSDVTPRVFRWRGSTGMTWTGWRGYGRDINRAGEIVGESYWDGAAPHGEGFLISPGNVITFLGTNPGNFASYADAVNDSGAVAGVSYEGSPTTVLGHPWIGTHWSAGSHATTAHLPAPALRSWLYGINNAGQMVGVAADTGGLRRGFRHTPGVGYEYIKPWSASVHVTPQDVNEYGTVAGYQVVGGSTTAFRWSPSAGFLTLGPAGEEAVAYAINGSDYAVGHAAGEPAYWQPNGTRVFLPRLSPLVTACCSASATAINEHLAIVGYDQAPNGEIHAVLWRVKNFYTIYTKFIPINPRPELPYVIDFGAGGLLQLAVLASPELDVRRIDPGIFRLGDDDGADTPVARDREGGLMASYRDVDEDGDVDLVLHFDQRALEENRDLTPETTALHLTGYLGAGGYLTGALEVEVRR